MMNLYQKTVGYFEGLYKSYLKYAVLTHNYWTKCIDLSLEDTQKSDDIVIIGEDNKRPVLEIVREMYSQ